tara:strand:+ start:373 stop:477 length:105 start_codon:yes stop_codon:yes gene_type:complete
VIVIIPKPLFLLDIQSFWKNWHGYRILFVVMPGV